MAPKNPWGAAFDKNEAPPVKCFPESLIEMKRPIRRFLGAGGLDAAGPLQRVAWLLNADGLFPDSEPQTAGRTRIAASSFKY